MVSPDRTNLVGRFLIVEAKERERKRDEFTTVGFWKLDFKFRTVLKDRIERDFPKGSGEFGEECKRVTAILIAFSLCFGILEGAGSLTDRFESTFFFLFLDVEDIKYYVCIINISVRSICIELVVQGFHRLKFKSKSFI